MWHETGLPRREAKDFVGAVIEEIAAALVPGEKVTILRFGGFETRDKGFRMGRNPKTGEPARIVAQGHLDDMVRPLPNEP